MVDLMKLTQTLAPLLIVIGFIAFGIFKGYKFYKKTQYARISTRANTTPLFPMEKTSPPKFSSFLRKIKPTKKGPPFSEPFQPRKSDSNKKKVKGGLIQWQETYYQSKGGTDR